MVQAPNEGDGGLPREDPPTPHSRRKSDVSWLERVNRWVRRNGKVLTAISAGGTLMVLLWNIWLGVSGGIAKLDSISLKLDDVSKELEKRAVWMGESNATHAGLDRRLDKVESAQQEAVGRIIRLELTADD